MRHARQFTTSPSRRRLTRRSATMAGLAAITLAATACGSSEAPAADAPAAAAAPAGSSAPGATATASADVVPEILRFDAALVGGGRYDSALAAGKPVALWFWAPT